MLSLSRIHYKTRLGQILRLPLCLLPKNMVMPVWQGKLRGHKWIVGSFNHGCWLGSYESRKQDIIAEMVTPGTVFFDIGAHVGFYTLLASFLVRKTGKVFSFEPLPRNIEYLRTHLMMNEVKNVTVFEAAVSDRPGKAVFHQAQSSSMGHIDENGDLLVALESLDELFLNGFIPLPDYIKIDVEGAELSVLTGAKHILSIGRPTIFLATHGAELHRNCLCMLRNLGYNCRPLDSSKDVRSCLEIVATK